MVIDEDIQQLRDQEAAAWIAEQKCQTCGGGMVVIHDGLEEESCPDCRGANGRSTGRLVPGASWECPQRGHRGLCPGVGKPFYMREGVDPFTGEGTTWPACPCCAVQVRGTKNGRTSKHSTNLPTHERDCQCAGGGRVTGSVADVEAAVLRHPNFDSVGKMEGRGYALIWHIAGTYYIDSASTPIQAVRAAIQAAPIDSALALVREWAQEKE